MATLRTREIFDNTTYKVIVVESVDIRHSTTKMSRQLYGFIEPIAVVVYGPGGIVAFDVETGPVSFDQLSRNIPELDAMFAQVTQVS